MPAKRLKIAFVTLFQRQDINNWSGTVHFIGRTLQKHVGDVTYINAGDRNVIRIIGVLDKYWNRLFDKKFYWERTRLYWFYHARRIKRLLKQDQYDIVFSPGTIPLGMLETDLPVYMYTDATFHSMIDYYMHDLSSYTKKSGDALELLTYQKCRMIFLSSDWAAESAMSHYGIPREKVAVVPFGANVETRRTEDNAVRPIGHPVKFLFIGVDPVRKGLSRAIAVVEKINALGIDAGLDIVGCNNTGGLAQPYLRWFGFLDKNDEGNVAKIQELYSKADFFIMPSKAECSAVVYCEAASYGLPLIGSDTGGTPTIIRDSVNGILMEPGESVDCAAQKIVSIIRDAGTYAEMRKNSKKISEERLNWDSAGLSLQYHINRSLRR